MDNYLLSILIPSIPNRSQMLNELFLDIFPQIQKNNFNSGKYVELLIDSSAAYLDGGLSIGKKREALVNRAKGKYVCFLDDDDKISPDYIETLVDLCKQGADVCTFRAFIKLFNGWGTLNMSLENEINEEFTPNKLINRPPWHICPVKREYATLYEFPDINNAEDWQWFSKVLKHCNTEAHTNKYLYEYNHGTHSEADKIENTK